MWVVLVFVKIAPIMLVWSYNPPADKERKSDSLDEKYHALTQFKGVIGYTIYFTCCLT